MRIAFEGSSYCSFSQKINVQNIYAIRRSSLGFVQIQVIAKVVKNILEFYRALPRNIQHLASRTENPKNTFPGIRRRKYFVQGRINIYSRRRSSIIVYLLMKIEKKDLTNFNQKIPLQSQNLNLTLKIVESQ